VQPAADVAWHDGAGDSHGERAITRLLKAAAAVVVGGDDEDRVPTRLQHRCRVHNEPLRAADAEVRVEKDGAQRA